MPQNNDRVVMTRPSLLRAAGLAGIAGTSAAVVTGTAARAAVPAGGFAHPGLLHTRTDLDRIRP